MRLLILIATFFSLNAVGMPHPPNFAPESFRDGLSRRKPVRVGGLDKAINKIEQALNVRHQSLRPREAKRFAKRKLRKALEILRTYPRRAILLQRAQRKLSRALEIIDDPYFGPRQKVRKVRRQGRQAIDLIQNSRAYEIENSFDHGPPCRR